MAPPPPPRWLLLDHVAHRDEDEEGELLLPGRLRLDVVGPPEISNLTIPRRGLPSPVPAPAPAGATGSNLFVLGADQNLGLLLAYSASDTPLADAAPGTTLYLLHQRSARDSPTVSTVPGRSVTTRPIRNLASLGVISSPARDGCIVAELQHDTARSDSTALLVTIRLNSSARWTERSVPYPEALLRLHRGQAWSGHGVFPHGGDLCWYDLSKGILRLDPYKDDPTLRFDSLPYGSLHVDVGVVGDARATTTRCISVSDGRIVFAELRLQAGVDNAPPRIVLWTLTASQPHLWQREITRPLADIWAATTDLARSIPDILLVHPLSNVLFLCLDHHLLEFDLRRSRLRSCRHLTSRRLIAWQIPSFVCTAPYPRYCGWITAPGCIVHLVLAGPWDLLMVAEHCTDKVHLHLRLWTRDFDFAELYVRQQLDSPTCTVRVRRRSQTAGFISKVLPISLCLFYVPVPDFGCVFRAFHIIPDVVHTPSEATEFTGKETHRGFYSDSAWKVEFVEKATPAGPVLLLRYVSPVWTSFRAQLLCWPSFYLIRIIKLEGPGYKVVFAAEPDDREQSMWIVSGVVRMLPLPCLSALRESFGDQ